jgi:hypothetical protein
MKQTFEIESIDGINVMELLGMLEEGNSTEVWRVKEITK